MFIIRDANPQDAEFIVDTVMGALGEELCIHLAGGKKKLPEVRKLFRTLARREDSQYSFLNTCIAEINGEKAGAIVAYDGALLHSLRPAFMEAANEILGWDIKPEDVEKWGDEAESDEFYLDSIYVAPEFRGKGVASRLIAHVIEKNRSIGKKFGLLVEPENSRARHLYEANGFREVGINNFFMVPMHHLQKELS